MGTYEVRKLTPEDRPELWGVRAGVELRDWAGDSVTFTDGGDGSMYMQMGVFDVCTNVEGVRALRDYLNEVLSAPLNDDDE